MTKFALATYTTGNIGDDIQSLAARRFLPQVDYFVNRDFINDFKADTDEKVKMILNGWYTHQPNNFPITNPHIDPFLISMYIDDSVKEVFSSEGNKEFFKKYGPVGARCEDTKNFLDGLGDGIESYLSTCLTLTLKPDPGIKKQDFVLALDLPAEAFEKLQRESKYPVIRISADVTHQYMTPERRLAVAEYYLYLYQAARFVVTTRLHGTLPCLALGTPVLNLEVEGFEVGRFAGLRELANHMTVKEFMTGNIDVNKPRPNPTTYKKHATELAKRCRKFTGCDKNTSFLYGRTVEDLFNDAGFIQSLVTGLWSGQQYWGVIKYR